MRERDAVLRATRAGERRLDGREVELDHLGVGRLLARVVPEHVLLAVRLDEREPVLAAAGEAQIAQRQVVDGEEAAGRAVLGRHVPDRGAIGERQAVEPVPEVLDELPDHARLAQDLGDGQDEIGRRRALGELAGQLEADDLRDEHRERLPELRRLGLDPADPPAQHTEPVHHRRVRVGADERVGEGPAVSLLDDPSEELEVHLMDDSRSGRHDLEVPEALLAPAEEGVALAVALELELDVADERAARAEDVDLHRVVDHELDGNQRVDLLRAAAQVRHRVAHRGEVDDGRDAGEVLEQDARRRERDLAVRLVCRDPARHGFDVRSVAGPEHVLEQDSQRVGEALDIPLLLERVEPVDLELAITDREC